jgi:hypothetical protein
MTMTPSTDERAALALCDDVLSTRPPSRKDAIRTIALRYPGLDPISRALVLRLVTEHYTQDMPHHRDEDAPCWACDARWVRPIGRTAPRTIDHLASCAYLDALDRMLDQ